MLRKILSHLDLMLIWLMLCAGAGIAMIAHASHATPQ